MSIFKKTLKDASEQGAFLGAEASKKAQEATNQSIEGMNYFRNVAEAKKNERSGVLMAVISGSDVGKLYYILARSLDKLG